MDESERAARIRNALDGFQIEIPSWGFTNSGTRFGVFLQPAAANSLEEKFADANEVHRLTGVSPSLALNVAWDLPDGEGSVPLIKELEGKYTAHAGSISPTLFHAQEYKYGSICNPDAGIRRMALDHILECVRIGEAVGSADISIWLPDGSNYPGTQSMRKRIDWMQETLSEVHSSLSSSQRMLVEYKPFEPAFYHTDIVGCACCS